MSTDAKIRVAAGLAAATKFPDSFDRAVWSAQRVVVDGAGHGEAGGADGAADIGSAGGFGFAAALGFFFGAGLLATGGGGRRTGAARTSSA